MNRIGFFCVLLLIPSAARGDDAALSQLERNARAWEAVGREDKAGEAWERVLRSDPRHGEALAATAVRSAREGDEKSARALASRLEEAHPGHPLLGQVRRAITVGKRYGTLLDQARRLARDGRLDEAVRLHREIFGDEPPTDAVAVEVYQILAGTQGGWDEARRGLERAASRMPFPRPRLALATHLTYREATRRDGIRRLEALADHSEVAEAAREAWRQALLWLQAGSGDLSLFEVYRRRYPGDDEVWAKRPKESRKGKGGSVGRGFEALERSDLERAERIFQGARADAEAWVGLGLVALQREDFEKARSIFLRVKALAPKRRELWERSLRSATFWTKVREAEEARERGELSAARARLEEAKSVSQEEAPHAALILASIDLEQGGLEGAEPALRALCAGGPARAGACSLLAEALARADRLGEAKEINERLRAMDPVRAHATGHLEAEALRFGAERAIEAGFDDEAHAMLVEARSRDPENLWVLLALADLHARADRVPEAREVLDRAALLDPDVPEARVVEARLLVREGRFGAALDLLDELPTAKISPALRAERERLEVLAEVESIRKQELQGSRAAARQALLRLQWRVEREPSLSAVVARAWSDMGETERGAALMSQILASVREPSASLRLEATSVFLAAGKTEEVPRLLRELTDEPKLTPAERSWLEDLRVGHAVLRTDQLREQGEFLRGFNHLRPLLREYPENASLLSALGRLFRSDGQLREAHLVFLSALEKDPSNVDARQGALETGAELRMVREVRTLAEEGMRLAPDDAKVAFVSGRALVAVGEAAEGLAALERAQAILSREGSRGEEAGAFPAGSGAQGAIRLAAQRFHERERRLFQFQASQALAFEVQEEIRRVQGDLGTHIYLGGFTRYRSGEEGLGSLTELRSPFEMGTSLGFRGRVRLEVVPTLLDPGTLDRSDLDRASRFGWADRLLEGGGGRLSSRESGVATTLAYESESLSVDVGTSPLGFPILNYLGGLEWTGRWDAFSLTLGARRRIVTDSLLSYAGVRDPSGEEVFGGVTRNGGGFNLAYVRLPAVVYLHAGYEVLLGKGVEENQAGRGGGGIEWRLVQGESSRFTSGLDVSGMAYEKNLRHFTLGHGGYFSPQAFVHLGVPLKWSGESGNFGWDLSGDLGVNWFREEAVQAFPSDPLRQARFERLLHPETNAPFSAWYSEQTVMSFALNARPRIHLRLVDDVHIGLAFDYHTAQDYTEITGGVFFRTMFSRPSKRLDPKLVRWDG